MSLSLITFYSFGGLVCDSVNRVLDAITVVHLPNGPTAYFKLSSVQLIRDILVIILSFSTNRHTIIMFYSFFRDTPDPRLTIQSSFSTISSLDWVIQSDGSSKHCFRPYQSFRVDRSLRYTIKGTSCFSDGIGTF